MQRAQVTTLRLLQPSTGTADSGSHLADLKYKVPHPNLEP